MATKKADIGHIETEALSFTPFVCRCYARLISYVLTGLNPGNTVFIITVTSLALACWGQIYVDKSRAIDSKA